MIRTSRHLQLVIVSTLLITLSCSKKETSPCSETGMQNVSCSKDLGYFYLSDTSIYLTVPPKTFSLINPQNTICKFEEASISKSFSQGTVFNTPTYYPDTLCHPSTLCNSALINYQLEERKYSASCNGVEHSIIRFRDFDSIGRRLNEPSIKQSGEENFFVRFDGIDFYFPYIILDPKYADSLTINNKTYYDVYNSYSYNAKGSSVVMKYSLQHGILKVLLPNAQTWTRID